MLNLINTIYSKFKNVLIISQQKATELSFCYLKRNNELRNLTYPLSRGNDEDLSLSRTPPLSSLLFLNGALGLRFIAGREAEFGNKYLLDLPPEVPLDVGVDSNVLSTCSVDLFKSISLIVVGSLSTVSNRGFSVGV